MFDFLKNKKKVSHSHYLDRAPDHCYPKENPQESPNRAYFWVQEHLLISEVFGTVNMQMAQELVSVSDRILSSHPYLIAGHNWVGIDTVEAEVQQYLTTYSSQERMEGKLKAIAIYGKISVKLLASSFKYHLMNRHSNNGDITTIMRTKEDFDHYLSQTISSLGNP